MKAIDEDLRRLLLSLGFNAGDKLPTASQLNERLTAAYERGRSEQRAADVAALKESGDFEFMLAADFLLSESPILGGEGPETP